MSDTSEVIESCAGCFVECCKIAVVLFLIVVAFSWVVAR